MTLKAGSTTVAPLQLTSGTNLTTPLSGAIEYDGTNLYFTNSTPARLTLATVGGAQTFSGADTFSGDVSMTGAGTGLAVTNNETVGGTMQITGATSLNGGATVAANQNLAMTAEQDSSRKTIRARTCARDHGYGSCIRRYFRSHDHFNCGGEFR